jgi:hypothetical protein
MANKLTPPEAMAVARNIVEQMHPLLMAAVPPPEEGRGVAFVLYVAVQAVDGMQLGMAMNCSAGMAVSIMAEALPRLEQIEGGANG